MIPVLRVSEIIKEVDEEELWTIVYPGLDGLHVISIPVAPPETSKIITSRLKIPTIGIGSSVYCDGQILVTDDMLGLSGFYPKFVKKYENLNRVIEKAVKKYTREVKLKKFPAINNFLYGTKRR